jgi:acyl-CoA dehydrogenase
MIDLDIAKKHVALKHQARMVADNVFRPISRKYDTAEHAYPKELDFLASLIDGLNESGAGASAKLEKGKPESDDAGGDPKRAKNGANLATVIGTIELCRGDVGLLLEPTNGPTNPSCSMSSRSREARV